MSIYCLEYWNQIPTEMKISHYQVECGVASFPGFSAWRRKRAWYTRFAHAQFPQDFWGFGNFRKIFSITLTSTRYADFIRIKDACHWPRSVWTMTNERQKYSALRLQELSVRSCIPAKDCSTWLTQSLPLKFTNHFKRSDADSYCRSDIV